MRLTVSDANPVLDPEQGNTPSEFQSSFCRDTYVVAVDDDGQSSTGRSLIVRGPNGGIASFSAGGRLYQHMD
jgi:hypothetical protein